MEGVRFNSLEEVFLAGETVVEAVYEKWVLREHGTIASGIFYKILLAQEPRGGTMSAWEPLGQRLWHARVWPG